MNKAMIFLAVNIVFSIIPIALFAGGRKEGLPIDKSCNLTIQNKTNTTIVNVVIKETNTEIDQFFDVTLENNTSSLFTVNRNTSYDIVLTDKYHNRYGKQNQKWAGKAATVSVEHTDLIRKNLWDIIKALFTWPL